jgi:hypothetical protein
MALDTNEREQVISTAVDLLRHPKRERLMKLLEERIERGDYPDDAELRLDRLALTIARTIDAELAEGA